MKKLSPKLKRCLMVEATHIVLSTLPGQAAILGPPKIEDVEKSIEAVFLKMVSLIERAC